MKNLLPTAVLALALLGTLTVTASLRAADDTTRRAQQALRDGGFYYGPIDGAPGDETTQALRRYQIRNGLPVSGQLNADTLRALGINAPPPPGASSSSSTSTPTRSPRNEPTPRPDRAAEPTPPPLNAPTPAPPRTITGNGRPFPPAPTPRLSPPAYGNNNNNNDIARPDLRVAPLPPGAQAPSVPLTGFFSRTPYEFAPPAVQADVLRRAQRALAQGGFYDGPPDGQPGRRTVEAIGEFQGAFRLTRSRRLDAPTLRVLRLLPGRDSNLPEPLPARRRGAPERDLEDEENDADDAPPIRIRPRGGGGPEVYPGRIIR